MMISQFESLRARIRTKGRIEADDVAAIRQAIYHTAGAARPAVTREEAELLFELNRASDHRANDPGWIDLFVEAIKRHMLDDPTSPGRVDAAETQWLMSHIRSDGQLDAGDRAVLWNVRHAVPHSEVWGGIHTVDLEADTSGLTAHLYCRACDGGKGGDFYYFSVSETDTLTRIALADVCGHGEPVTTISQWLYDCLKARLNSGDGGAVLGDLNRLAAERGFKAMTTAAVLTFDRAEMRIDYSYAGHPPVYLCRKGQRQWQPLLLEGDGLANLPLGVVEDAEYHQGKVPLAAGDRLFLYTDGVIEAPDASGNLFDAEGVLATLESHAQQSPKVLKNAMLASLWKHTGGNLAHDDVTFIVAEVT
jgi:sigma-B regulation protein RsbU (phosphoserine phosphatase)